MPNPRTLICVLCLGTIVLSLSACGISNADKERKREEDRMAIHLTEAEHLRDEYKAQLDQAKAALVEAQGKTTLAQQDLAAVRTQLKAAVAARDQALADKSTAEDKANAAAAKQALFKASLDQAVREREQAQQQVEHLSKQMTAMRKKLSDLESAGESGTSAPTTQLNK